MAVPQYIDPAETKFAHARTDLGAFDKVVEMNERLAFAPDPAAQDHGSVFIVGLQRSGTTLLYQVAASGTDAGYINNLIARFWESPAFGVYLQRHLGLRKRISFESVHGTTEAVTDVHEFGYFWASLFGTKSNSALSDIDPATVDWALMRAKLASITAAFERPCLHKSTLVGHFMSRLVPVLNKKLFVYIRRDFLEIAASVLKVRKARYGDVNHWWSLKPYEYDQIAHLAPHEQVVGQLYHLHRDLEKQAEAVPGQWLWEVGYDELCADPRGFLEELQRRAAKAGIKIGLSGSPPPKLTSSKLDPADEDVWKLAHYLDAYHLPYKAEYRA